MFLRSALALALLHMTLARAETPPPARDLMAASDRARGTLASGAEWTVKLDTRENGESSKQEYFVRVLGNAALVEARFPPKDKGNILLFNDRNLWFFKPGLRKPVAFSRRQKLSGVAANGDIASTDYVRDYEGKVLGEEVIEGQPTWKLELTARATEATYDKIRYWVTKKERLGIKAELLSVQNVLLKVATLEYKNKLTIAGKSSEFVSKMTIRDATFPDNVSVMTYDEPRSVKLSSAMFNVNNLVR